MTDKIVGKLIETSNEAAGYSLGPSEISEVLTLRARVAKLEAALQEAREFIAKERIKADPQRETCSECQGSGYGGHPDSGALCVKCNGTGEVAALKDAPQ